MMTFRTREPEASMAYLGLVAASLRTITLKFVISDYFLS